VAVLNSGMLALMISVGDRVGLFETMRSLPASTSAQVATAAGLDERYVREWLAALTAGGIVRHDPAAGTFELPPGYAEALSRGLGRPESIAAMCQHVAMLGKVEDRITEHFRQGGGVPYDTYEQLWGAGEPYDLDALDPMEVDHVLSLLPGIDERLAAGIDVADVGCGWGAQLNLLARRYPASRFVGFRSPTSATRAWCSSATVSSARAVSWSSIPASSTSNTSPWRKVAVSFGPWNTMPVSGSSVPGASRVHLPCSSHRKPCW
jgi:hypothetical protein